MDNQLVFLLIILFLILLNGFQFYLFFQSFLKKDKEIQVPVKEKKKIIPLNTPNQLKDEPENFFEGTEDFDISKVTSLKVNDLPPRKVKIYK